MPRPVTILGAGLVGSLLAVVLRKRGHPVTIYERRPDMRAAGGPAGRSINLAMSTRGWKALDLAGLRSEIEELAIPMTGRFLHQTDGSTAFQPYGKKGEAIYSVSRGELNKRLMTLAEREGATILFNQRVVKVDVAENSLQFAVDSSQFAGRNSQLGSAAEQGGELRPAACELLFGADGAFSALRTAYTYLDRTDASQHYLTHAYKELHIPADEAGGWRMEKGALHIWPRQRYMLIALPNTDGSFTCTLFLPFEGEISFEKLQTEADVQAFFEEHFADAVPRMPGLLHDFFANPTASLITTHISRWHYGKKSVLIGDAAHAIVPFYGQGMNAGFEDVTVLTGLLDEYGEDWDRLLPHYQRLRKPAGDAVARLALLNFEEMRDKVADPAFLERKRLEKELGLRYPDRFVSVYELVSFSHTPYDAVISCIAAQDKLLDRIHNAGGAFRGADGADAPHELEAWMEEYHAAVKNLPLAAPTP